MSEKSYTKEEIKALKDKKAEIERILRKQYLKEISQQIEDNKKYVGKCYFDTFGKRYIKIISQYGDNQNCVIGLCINCNDTLLTCGVDFRSSGYLSAYSNEELFYTDYIYLSELPKLTEVSTEEFNQVMDKTYEQFKVAVDEFASNVENQILWGR